MLSGLLAKILRETRGIIALTCLALAATMALFVQILPQLDEGLNAVILQAPFVRALVSGLMGMDVSSGLSPQMLLVVVWSHPIVLAIVWGFAVVFCTRFPAAEIERGTIDVLLGWPVSRRAVYWSEVLVCLAAGVLLLASGFTGFVVSTWMLAAELRPVMCNTLLTLLNLFAVYVAVGGMVHGISSACDRRSVAMGIAVAFLLASYLIHFLSTLWAPAEHVAIVSFVHYYQPAQVMLNGTLPLRDVLVLLAAGASTWGIGGVVWGRRSVLTT